MRANAFFAMLLAWFLNVPPLPLDGAGLDDPPPAGDDAPVIGVAVKGLNDDAFADARAFTPGAGASAGDDSGISTGFIASPLSDGVAGGEDDAGLAAAADDGTGA